ncbi:hypothetical protein TWF281_006378 [Arthrobotrys megalospora]
MLFNFTVKTPDMKVSTILRAACYAAVAASTHASLVADPTGIEVPEPRHRLEKRMFSSLAADLVGDFVRTTLSEITAWTSKHGSELDYYLQYSKEVRTKLAQLQTYGTERKIEPYIALLHSYSKQYLAQNFPGDPTAFVSWQDFIDEYLLTALQKPWEYKWKMPSFTLSPEDRIKGLSPELLDLYPHDEIEDEEAFDNRPLLLADSISTVEYLTQFSLPFPTTSNLTTWLLNPTPAPAYGGQATDWYIQLSRVGRIHDSFEAIRVQLEVIIEGLEGFDLEKDFKGEKPIPPASTEPIIAAIKQAMEDWQRIYDVIGVMSTITDMVDPDPDKKEGA